MTDRNPELDAAELKVLDLKARELELNIAAAERMSAKSTAGPDHTGHFNFVGPVAEAYVLAKMVEIQSYVDRHPGAPVQIYLNSMGGHVWDGFALIDFLERIQREGVHVRIVGSGVVASMAGIILQCATERVLTKRAWFHAHELSNMIRGSISEQEDTLKLGKAMQEQAVELLCSKSHLTPAKLKSLWSRKEAYLDAKAALKLGLIDHIEGE